MSMKCALAAIGFMNGDIAYNKAVLVNTLRKRAGRADVVIFGEAFLQGFNGICFSVEHDMATAVPREDAVIREIRAMAGESSVAVSFGFIEKDCGAFFSSQMTVDKNGRIIDLYRRVSRGWKAPFAGKVCCSPRFSRGTARFTDKIQVDAFLNC